MFLQCLILGSYFFLIYYEPWYVCLFANHWFDLHFSTKRHTAFFIMPEFHQWNIHDKRKCKQCSKLHWRPMINCRRKPFCVEHFTLPEGSSSVLCVLLSVDRASLPDSSLTSLGMLKPEGREFLFFWFLQYIKNSRGHMAKNHI